jgi:hypothetical protein
MNDDQVISILFEIKTSIAILTTKLSEIEKRQDAASSKTSSWQAIVYASLLSFMVSLLTPFFMSRFYEQKQVATLKAVAGESNVAISFYDR